MTNYIHFEKKQQTDHILLIDFNDFSDNVSIFDFLTFRWNSLKKLFEW